MDAKNVVANCINWMNLSLSPLRKG